MLASGCCTSNVKLSGVAEELNAGVQRIGCSTSAVDTDRRQSLTARFTE